MVITLLLTRAARSARTSECKGRYRIDRVRSEKKRVIVDGQRRSDRSALLVPFPAKKTDTRGGRKWESGLDVLLRVAEVTTGGCSCNTLIRLSRIDPQPLARADETVCRVCLIYPDMFDETIFSWFSVTSQGSFLSFTRTLFLVFFFPLRL